MSSWGAFNYYAMHVIRLAYINVLWIVFSVLGLVVFTFFPSTVAMFETVKQMIQKDDEKEVAIFQTFWHSFKAHFLKVNAFGAIFSLIGYFLYIDLTFLRLYSEQLQILFPLLYLIIFLYILLLLFFLPVYLHYDLNFFAYFKQTFLIVAVSPGEIILISLTVALIYVVMWMLPSFIPLFMGSAFAYTSLKICHQTFKRIAKHNQTNQL